MNSDEFKQAQQRGLEAMQAFNSFTDDPEYPRRTAAHLNYYRTIIMPKGYHPLTEQVLREGIDAALEICAYYPKHRFSVIPKPAPGETVGPDHFQALEEWFLTADGIITAEGDSHEPRAPSDDGLSNLPDETILRAVTEELAAKEAKALPANANKPDKPLKDRFVFRGDGQALFDGKDLELPTGFTIPVLTLLVNSFGEPVPYKTLDENSGKTAGDNLRAAKHAIQESFKRHHVPCKVVTKKGVAYLIQKKNARPRA